MTDTRSELIYVDGLVVGVATGVTVGPSRVPDLNRVVEAVRELWAEEMVVSWLTGANISLGGARPLDVVALEGAEPVLEALELEAAGGYA